jgi:short-subunit dehydrogenase
VIENVVILGATSGIAQPVGRLFAAGGAALLLAGRDPAKLNAVADDLRVRGARRVETFVIDFDDVDRHDSVIVAAQALGRIDAVLIAFGTLPDQTAIDRDPEAQLRGFHTNATAVISLGARFANALEDARGGMLAVIGSVAGDRGRRSNYVYGAAKAAIHAYFEGLRGRLHGAGVKVLVVKPGWIDTPMTAHLRRNFLYATADAAGAATHRAMMRGREEVYVPGFWRWIMLAIHALPASVMKHLSI